MSAEHMQRYYQTYNSEDPQGLRAFYHDDVVLASAQGETVGADGIIATYQYLIDQFSDQMTPESITISEQSSDKDFVAQVKILDRFTAKKAVDDFMGQSLAEGESFELNLLATYKVVDGRFKHINIDMR